MNKRRFKKQLQYDISDAIDLVLLQQLKNDKADDTQTEKKVDSLLHIYDEAFAHIGKARTLKTGKERKQHFKSILENFDKQIESIILGK
jgi:hypothetical protein